MCAFARHTLLIPSSSNFKWLVQLYSCLRRSALYNWKVVWGSLTSHGLNSQRFCVTSLQRLRILYAIFHIQTGRHGPVLFSIPEGYFRKVVAGLGGWKLGVSDVADSSGCFRQPEVCCSLLVMPPSFVFRGNNCTPQSFREESHITDAVNILFYVPFKEIWMADKWG